MLELLTNNHFDRILDLFDSVQQKIQIISPFLTISMAEKLCETKKQRNISCDFITRFYIEDMLNKANSMDAIELLMDSGINVYAVKRLHTKLYLFDDTHAIMGSANFTNGGFKSNIELSLLVSDETMLIDELHEYFDNMLSAIQQSDEGRITKEMLATARNIYAKSFDSKTHNKNSIIRNVKMFGAALNSTDNLDDTDAALQELNNCTGENDMVCDLFKETEKYGQIKYPYTIWLKFNGDGSNRLAEDQKFPIATVAINDKTVYLSNYPYKVHSVKEDDVVYIAAVSTDTQKKNQPIIVGRGRLAAFSKDNYASDSMIQQNPWMAHYPWYCIIKDCEILNTAVKNGIPLNWLLDALGSNTYVASFGRNENITDVATKHFRKAHIRLSGNAKDLIDKKFDALKKQYRVIQYHSDI